MFPEGAIADISSHIYVTYCDFARSWFDKRRAQAAFDRMIVGEDFETVLEEELRSKSEDEDEVSAVEDSGSDDDATEVDISSEESEDDGPDTDDEPVGMSLEVAGGVVELSDGDDDEKKGNNSSILNHSFEDDAKGLHFKNYPIMFQMQSSF